MANSSPILKIKIKMASSLGFRAKSIFMRFKTSLLLIFGFLCSQSANAELMGGHDLQRLNLIFLQTLNQHVQMNPIALHLTDFPIEIPSEGDFNRQQQALFQVLVEEGLLVTSKTTADLAVDETQVKRVQSIRYEPIQNQQTMTVKLATPEIENILSIDVVKAETGEGEDGLRRQYQVKFSWRTKQIEEWLWAPSLSNHTNILKIRSSLTSPKEGSAEFLWSDGYWRLTANPQLF